MNLLTPSLEARMDMAGRACKALRQAGYIVEHIDLAGDEAGPHLDIRPGWMPHELPGLPAVEEIRGRLTTIFWMRTWSCLVRWRAN